MKHWLFLLDATVIPGAVKAQLSLRIVPDQELEALEESLQEFLISSFNKLQSPNSLKVSIATERDELLLTIR